MTRLNIIITIQKLEKKEWIKNGCKPGKVGAL